MSAAGRSAPPAASSPAQRVAIVGAGPCGISAARELVKAGYGVTLFDKEAASGGLKRYGYPSFRMPSSISEREAAQLKELGVEFRGGAVLGETIGLVDLQQEYAAVLLAVGAPIARTLGIPGEELPGVYDALRYLYCSRTDQPLPPGDDVLVVGGGDTAVDAATTALSLGAKRVTMLSRRSSESALAAQPHEIKYAKDKGVEFRFNAVPVKIEAVGVADDGPAKPGTARLDVTLAAPADRTAGTAASAPSGNSAGNPKNWTERFDTVIVAIGQDRNTAFIKSLGVTVAAEGSTDRPNVFAAGGALYGSQRLVNAIIDGRRAAQQIVSYLSGRA